MKYFYLILCLILSGCKTPIQPRINNINISDYRIEVIAPGDGCDTEFLKAMPVTFNGFYEDDYKRAEVIKKSLLNNTNDVLWALRGGYGTAKVVEILYQDVQFFNLLKKQKKHPIVIGYSDITALHLFLSKEFGWETIHGLVFSEIINTKKQINIKAIKEILNGIRKIKFIGLKPLNKPAETLEKISGKLTGGNISIIQTSIGTKWQINTKDKILFLEDCHEKPYQISRMLEHLKSAKILDGVKAIIIGNLCNDSNYMNQIILNFAKNLSIPIYSIDVFGHGVYNYPMIYNSDAEILSEHGIKSLKQQFDL